MADSLQIGDAFLLPTPPNEKHLFVVIAPTPAGAFLCVNVTTRRHRSDTSCILRPGDHRFIRHESVINYRDAREIDAETMAELVSRGISVFYPSFDARVVQRIQQGGLNSKRLKNRYKNYLRAFLDTLG